MARSAAGRAGICHTAGPRLASSRLDSGLANRCGALGTSPGAAPRCRGHAAAVACAVQCRLLYGILCRSTPILSQCAWRFAGHMGPKGAAGWGAWGGDWGGMGRPKQGSLYGENPFGMWAKKGVIPPFATTLERSTHSCVFVLACGFPAAVGCGCDWCSMHPQPRSRSSQSPRVRLPCLLRLHNMSRHGAEARSRWSQ